MCRRCLLEGAVTAWALASEQGDSLIGGQHGEGTESSLGTAEATSMLNLVLLPLSWCWLPRAYSDLILILILA